MADVCPFCRELVLDTDRRDPNMRNAVVHWECGFRQVIGGVNHQKRLCRCFGGTESPDPPGLTRREAALAAVRFAER